MLLVMRSGTAEDVPEKKYNKNKKIELFYAARQK